MRLNIQKFTIWYCRLDITVFQSIQNMWILLNITNLQYIFWQDITVFQSIQNAFEYFWIYKMYNMIFLTGHYSIAEYSKCIWILLNIQNVQYDILNRILQYTRVFKMHLNTFEYTKCTIWYFKQDITVLQSIQNAFEYFWIYKMYNMIFLTWYYSIAEYSKCIWILLNIKKNAIWYFLTGYNSILEYSRDVNTSEYKTNYNTIFLTGYNSIPQSIQNMRILLNI